MHLQSYTQFMKNSSLKLTARNIALIAMMVAVIEACKFVMANIPNIELTSFWIIMFTLYFGARIIYVIPVFILIEGVMYGIGPWWTMYLYAWPILALVTWMFRKNESRFTLACVSGVFGLLFGAMCSLVYFVTGGPYAAFTWWIAGIPWDFTHAVGNFVLMFLLYKPIKYVMIKTKNMVMES